MISKIKISDKHNLVMVSKNAIIYFIALLLILTLLLIVLFSVADFDSIFGTKNLAIKVGQTAITIVDFKTIKDISGAKAQAMTVCDFANDLVKLLLLAEKGRELKLDKTPKFKSKIAEFDNSLTTSSDTDKIAKSIYLIEELAKATRESLLQNFTISASTSASIEMPTNLKPKLRVRTILVKSLNDANKILEESKQGTDFKTLNASWSVSLYRFVNGDLGWREPNDFPAGVFDALTSIPIGSLTIGMTDENGVHIYSPVSKKKTFSSKKAISSKEMEIATQKSKYIANKIVELKRSINFYICPSLRNKCKAQDIN